MTKRDAAGLVAVLACAAISVIHKFENQFVFDDLFVIGGALIHDPGRIGEVFASHALIAHGDLAPMPMDTYRPLSLLTFFWDSWLAGRETWSYHLTNLLLHLAVVACVFALARRLLPQASTWTLASAALFFGLSPQLAEAHVWINGRSDPLATLFGLLALLVWSTGGARLARGAAAGALFFAGLLCKEVLLFGLPALLWWPSPEPASLVRRARDALPFALAGAGYLALRGWALRGLHAAGAPGQLQKALANVPVLWADGLSELIAPSRLYLRSMRDEYGLLSAGQRALIALAVLACAGLVLLGRKRLPVLRWGMIWFACTLAPAAMISALLWPGFGRFLYLPCVGLALGLAELLERGREGLARRFADTPERQRWARWIASFALAVYLVSLGARLAAVADQYADNKTLYLSAALAAPRPAYAYAAYGTARGEAGDHAGAIGPLAEAVRLEPGEPAYLWELAHNHMLAGHAGAAASILRSGIARSPAAQAGDLRILLVQALAGQDPAAAMAELCQCLHYQPQHAECLNAPRWLLDPRGPRAAEYREAFANFGSTCKSERARRALARALGSQASAAR